jgi:hypothetical protein
MSVLQGLVNFLAKFVEDGKFKVKVDVDSLTASNVAIDQSEDGVTNKVVATLSGSIPEYGWLTGATAPTPTEDFAWGNEFNASTGALKVYGWTGSAWVEVV